MFLSNDSYKTDGIAMLDAIIEHLQPTHAEHLLAAVTDLSDLTYKPTDTSISYMKTVQEISERLKGVDILRLVPLFPSPTWTRTDIQVSCLVPWLMILPLSTPPSSPWDP